MTKIEWCDVVWNPVVGCSRVSAGCEICYAERVAHRGMSPQHRGLTVLGKHGPRWNGTVRFLPDRLGDPLRWRKPRRVFVNSMSDLFHEKLTNEQIAAVFGVMAACPQHTFQILTKRAARMREWFAFMGADAPGRVANAEVRGCSLAAARVFGTSVAALHPVVRGEVPWPLPNVWLGVSAEDQAAADARIPQLLDTPAAIRWVSYEPALGPVDFTRWLHDSTCLELPFCICTEPREAHLDWIVVGGESGAGARPFDIGWARAVVGQCAGADVPCFVKQLGADPGRNGPVTSVTSRVLPGSSWWPVRLVDRKGGDMNEWPADLRIREFPEVARGR